ncbi:hypothetical protein FMK66_00220 [Klebsiella michiganensis]|uniref:hypothetical protein n=1 Tax=Klebsiella michiganensis TaxID=1134687 RepID=UPI001CCE2767|nr:hypothetical protein [Klebsiella michiganensis]MBZ7205907.1 hypothetical protein [Klebsiella michiganensis]
MTDITKLAQREKFEAWWEREYKHLESSKYTDAVPHIKYGFWMAYQAGGAELVDALEKAQTERDEFRRRFNLERSILEDADKDLETLRQRIAELESRTVKLPDDAEHDIMAPVAAYLSEKFKWDGRAVRWDGRNEYDALADRVKYALRMVISRTAGIKVEAE